MFELFKSQYLYPFATASSHANTTATIITNATTIITGTTTITTKAKGIKAKKCREH